MTVEKEGRPPASIAAWRSLHARDRIERRYPSVAALIDMLAMERVDLATVISAVEAAKTELREGRYREHEDLLPNASLDEQRLHTAGEFERLSQDRWALADLGTTIANELAAIQAKLDDSERRLLRLSLEREPVDGYIHTARPKLAAAGLTATTARSIGPDRIMAIRTALSPNTPVKTPPPAPVTRRKAEDALAWRLDNPWGTFLSGVKGYDFRPQPTGSGGTDVASLRRCGLPPHLDLADFGYPFLMGAVGSAKEPVALQKACWAVCSRWINDHITDTLGSNIEVMRERAWSFLFGLRYGYADAFDRYNRVNLPSPWQKDEQIIAFRRG